MSWFSASVTYFILSIKEIKSPSSAYLIIMSLFVWRDFIVFRSCLMMLQLIFWWINCLNLSRWRLALLIPFNKRIDVVIASVWWILVRGVVWFCVCCIICSGRLVFIAICEENLASRNINLMNPTFCTGNKTILSTVLTNFLLIICSWIYWPGWFVKPYGCWGGDTDYGA